MKKRSSLHKASSASLTVVACPVLNALRKPALAGLALFCASTAMLRAGEPSKTVEPSESDPAEPWSFSLALPGWLASTSGTMGVNGVNTPIYIGVDTIITNLDMIASFSGEARKGRFGLYSDFLYISASDGVGQPGLVEKLDVRLDQYLIDLELNYRVLEGPRGFVDVRAGVRYTNLYSELAISPDDEQIDRASTELVDDIGNRVRDALAEIDLRGRLRTALEGRVQTAVTSRITGLNGKRQDLANVPLGAREPDRLGEVVRAAINRRLDDLVAARQAEASATTEESRDAARRRVDSLKKRIAKDVSNKLKEGLNNTFTLAEDWWDPYVGVRARLNLTKAIYLTAKADIGGFGVGSDLTWQASGALGCQLTPSLHAELGYRYLYTDYNKDGFVYDVSQSGVEITAGITF
jgi:hypothetical protein